MIDIEEIWKPLDDYPNYDISSEGRVYSRKRGIILKPFLDGWHYPCVDLTDRNGHRGTRKIHRLVAKSFIPNPDNKPEVNHISGNKTDNSVDNLEWVTTAENQRHAVAIGLNDHSTYSAGKPKRRVEIIETGQIFDSIISCARYLGCTRGNVIDCLKTGRLTCKKYHVKYVI